MNIGKTIFPVLLAAAVLSAGVSLTGCSDFLSGARKVHLKGAKKTIEVNAPPGELAELYTVNINHLLLDENKASYVSVEYAEEPYVRAIYCQDLEDYGFSVSITDHEINISTDYDYVYSSEGFHLQIGANFDVLNLNGGYDILVDGSQIEDELTVNAGDFVDCWLNYLNLSQLNLNLDGTGECYIYAGKAYKVTADISGCYSITAKRLITRYCNLEISGDCTSDWSVRDSMTVEFSGAGELSYYGSPRVWQMVCGPGEITQAEEDIFDNK